MAQRLGFGRRRLTCLRQRWSGEELGVGSGWRWGFELGVIAVTQKLFLLKNLYYQMMKKLIIAVLTLLSLTACYSSQNQDSDEVRHFEITFDIDQEKNEEVSLIFEVTIDSGYYFVSPHSEGFHQRLIFSIEDTDSLLLNGELIEYPLTKEEHDKLSDKQGKFVRGNTTYNQNLILGSQNDFEVSGLIWLEMRPNCQPYEIRFVVSNRSGNLMIEKTSTSTSSYPTFWDKKRVDIPRYKAK